MSKELYKVNNSSFQDQINITDLTVVDVGKIDQINRIVEKHCDEITDQFYGKILSVPQLKHIIEEHSNVEKLKLTLKRHILSMFTKDLNEAYLAERNEIALMHYLVKLEPKWYIAAFQYLYQILQTLFTKEVENKEEAAFLSSVVAKYISLEMQIVLEAYETKVLSNLEIDDLLQQLEDETED